MNSKVKPWLAGGVAACLALLAIGYFLVVKPKKSDVSAEKAQVSTLASENSRLQIQLNQLKDRDKQVTEKQIELANIAKRIPSDTAEPTLIRRLQKDAQNSDVNLVSVTFTSPADSKSYVAEASPYQELTVNLEVHGTYASLREWFSHLEDADQRLIVAEQVTLKGPDASKASGQNIEIGADGIAESPNMITATITARTFFTSAATTSADLPALAGTSSAAPTS